MIYRKRGQTVRWENGTLIRVTESGVAWEEGERFICEPAVWSAATSSPLSLPAEPASVLPAILVQLRGTLAGFAGSESGDEVTALHTAGYTVLERLIAVEGFAEHSCGDRTWSEHTQRLHLALTHKRERALIDQADFDLTHIRRVAEGLARAGEERPAPPRLRLAPNVTAALIPTLLALAPPNVRIIQTAGGIDGKGEEIVEATHDWPNWYRPSYRTRPVRAPLNLRLECDVTEIDESRPRAIALLAPVTGLTLRVLVEDGERVYPSTVRITRINAVSSERIWYPHAAGTFGAELLL